jgi:hypothetical protein
VLTLPQKRLLIAAGLIGAFAVIPHLLLHLAEFLGSGILIAIAVAAGTWLAPRAGLTTPIIDAALTGQPFARRARSVVGLAIGLGVVAALAVVALNVLLFAPLLAQTTSAPPLWTRAPAALYGGLTEEILLRYGAMSFLAWLLTRVASGPTASWGAIVGAAALCGLAHLPATAALTPLAVTRAIVLNGLAAVVFG